MPDATFVVDRVKVAVEPSLTLELKANRLYSGRIANVLEKFPKTERFPLDEL